LSEPRVTVVVPTLAGGPPLLDCLLSLVNQTKGDIEVVIVDNSGRQLARQMEAERYGARVIESDRNVGFGAAINAAFRSCRAPFLATLNDDAVASPGWLEVLLAAMETRPEAGMCASQVRLAGEGRLDSAGMLICGDGSTKQRGHQEAPERYDRPEEVLFPSGCAALYRGAMLEEIGLFDEDFFLYCEDSDLGLRGRWAGWKCLYAPEAVVEHRYSQTAGGASPLKAYYVERNRLFLVAKNFPASRLVLTPLYALARYFWHALSMLGGRGSAARFRRENRKPLELLFIVLRAHCALLFHARSLWRKRREIQARARISTQEFRRLLDIHSISPRQVAAL
jgi:GT2 family glycosyltransferase